MTKRYLLIITSALMLFTSIASQAESDPKKWPVVKEAFFAGRTITDVDYIKFSAPRRAESGAQVPIEITVDQSQTGGKPIKNIYLLVDANPIPLATTYHLTDKLGNFKISTRIRMEMDSYIRAVGETADGQLVMGSVEVRAAGGCGGMIDADEKEIRAAAGKIKMNVEAPAQKGDKATVTFIIKHPMRTGLQRDLVSQGFIPAFYINKANFSFNNEPILGVDVNVGTSEDPYMRFEFLPSTAGTVKVEATDNEGKVFEHQSELKI